ELLRSGCIVTVLEAKKRFGGRMHTIRDGKLPIELGAEFIHGKSKPLLNAIRTAGLTTHEVPDSNRLFENGKLKRIQIWDTVGKVMNRIKRAVRIGRSGNLSTRKRSRHARGGLCWHSWRG